MKGWVMAAKTINEVRTMLAGGKASERFADGFAKAYFGQAMGILPKGEIDLLVFTLLVELEIIAADGSIFSIARALNVTPARAKSLLFQYQLRHIDEARGDLLVLKALAKAKYAVDEKRLSFGIESPLVRAIVEDKLKAKGVFADLSLSGEILKVPLAQFDDFIELLMGKEKAEDLEKALRKDGHLKEGSLRQWLLKYGTAAASGAAGAAGKNSFQAIFDYVSEFLESGDSSVFEGAMQGQT
jgi:hypothetical protein